MFIQGIQNGHETRQDSVNFLKTKPGIVYLVMLEESYIFYHPLALKRPQVWLRLTEPCYTINSPLFSKHLQSYFRCCRPLNLIFLYLWV